MQHTIELGTYIIDLADAMLEHGTHLHPMQRSQIKKIGQRAVDFVTGYLRHERTPLDQLLRYLQEQALPPVQALIGYVEILLSNLYGPLPVPYREALVEIQNCCYDIQADLIAMEANLLQFMETVALERA